MNVSFVQVASASSGFPSWFGYRILPLPSSLGEMSAIAPVIYAHGKNGRYTTVWPESKPLPPAWLDQVYYIFRVVNSVLSSLSLSLCKSVLVCVLARVCLHLYNLAYMNCDCVDISQAVRLCVCVCVSVCLND